MAALVVCLVLFFAMTGHSSATYCVCKDGLSEGIYQKDIDYACGAGADCTQISQNGACYNPNTVKAHCDYAVNSYFQKKGQTSGSCDFSGSATPSQSVPNQSSGCSYPSSGTSSGTPTTTPTPTTGTPTTPSTGTGTGTTTPSTGTGTTTPSTGTGTGTTTPNTGTGTGTTTPNTGTTTPSIFGLGPTGSGITNTDSSESTTLLHQKKTITMLFYSFALTLLFSSGFIIMT